MKKTPDRLLNEHFFKDDLPIRLYHDILSDAFELHWHEFYELTFILSGHGVNTVNGVPYPIQAGDLFLLTPADFHDIYPVQGQALELYNLIFSPHLLSGDMMQLLFSNERDRSARFESGVKYEQLLFRMNSLRYELLHVETGKEIALKCELDRLLIEWHRGRGKSLNTEEAGQASAERSVPYHPGIHKALIYIQHHFRQPITLEEASAHAHLSATYFSELFRKSLGLPFQQYLQHLRLQFAHSLLRSSMLPVTEVCYVSGFNTLTHFERVFRQQYGITPREAKK